MAATRSPMGHAVSPIDYYTLTLVLKAAGRQSQLAAVSDADRAMMLTQGLRNNGDLDIADPGMEGYVYGFNILASFPDIRTAAMSP